MLVEKFVREAEKSCEGAFHRDIEPEALDKLLSSDWPGNVRDLRNCMFNAVNNNPDVEYLYPLHIHLPGENSTLGKAAKVTERVAPTTGEDFGLDAHDFDGLIDAIDSFTFESVRPDQLIGKLSPIQRFLVRYLKAVVDDTRKRTPKEPEGKIQYHPAIKNMTGDDSLTAVQAADVMKRIINACREVVKPFKSDPKVNEICEKAKSLRRSSGRKGTTNRRQ